MVSHDPDMLKLHSRGVPHQGIAFFALRTRSIGQLVLKLVALSRNFEQEEMRGRVEYL